MSLEDLQSWLLEEGIHAELDELTRRTVVTELDNLVPDPDPDANLQKKIDWSRLLLAGSILARSSKRPYQESALRIATAALTLATSQQIQEAAAVLFDKLSNFRAVSLAIERKFLVPDLGGRLGVGMRLEAQRRKMEHAVLIESIGKWLPVNDFQQRFWTNASDHLWLSVSAPTASGKTFLVLQWLIDQMMIGDARVAIYLAPTRALVSEIEIHLQRLLGKDSGIEMSSLPLREKYEESVRRQRKLILVFTQERLHLLANLLRDNMRIDLLIVDEAHKIGDHQRGVVLQDAVERVSRINLSMKVVFISPATQNPEELLTDAPGDASSVAVNSDSPTVLQNVIIAEQVPGKPRLWNLNLIQRGACLRVGTLQLSSKPSGLRKRLAFIAAAVGERGGTLVYANGAAEAEDVAHLISQLVPASDTVDPELAELADLARKGVHRNFLLAPLVERGVAFHYGNMPSLIRMEVERLFRSGKIRFLVCTSTLIEGVNLSCRTIVLRGPRKGKGHPMEPHDFWNLAGRAGRWGNEFQGNIICIDPYDSNAWPGGVPERARFPIKRESDAVIELGGGMADYLDRRKNEPLSELKGIDQFEQVGAYLLTTYLRLGSISKASFAKRHKAADVDRLDESLTNLAEQIEITAEVAGRHPGVSAMGLQCLLNAFRSYEGDVTNLLPVDVESDDSFDRFVTVMKRINQYVYPAFRPEELVPLHALIVVQWLKGLSLSAMIKKNIEYHQKRRKTKKLSVIIRDTMGFVEQTARFRAPKYFSAYVDILNLFLLERDREDLISGDLDIGTQLEFGVSSKTLLSLMELGLSRMSAVSLYEKISRDDLSKNDCIQWVSEHQEQFEGMDIPTIIIREIREKLMASMEDGSMMRS